MNDEQSPSNAAEAKGTDETAALCAKCKSDEIELENDPCGCMKWCRKCAMKGARAKEYIFITVVVCS